MQQTLHAIIEIGGAHSYSSTRPSAATGILAGLYAFYPAASAAPETQTAAAIDQSPGHQRFRISHRCDYASPTPTMTATSFVIFR
jgi:hypothetical protein